MATSTVTHDLTEWSTAELELRYDTLEAFSAPINRADIDTFLDLQDKVLCGCGAPERCVVDSLSAIDDQLATRLY